MKIKITGQYFTLAKEEPGRNGNLPFPVQILNDDVRPLIPEECIRLRSSDAVDSTTGYMSDTGVWNTIQSEPDFLNSRLSLSAHLIQNPEHFFVEPTQSILAPIYEFPPGTKTFVEQRRSFRSSAEKHGVINQVRDCVEQIPGAKGLVDTVTSIADELFTNALFNAPFGNTQTILDRKTLVVLDPNLSPELVIGHTEERLFLGCLDFFGTLSCEKILGLIYRGFNAGIAKSVNMENGGAGIGILRMVDLASDIYMIVETRKKTLVGCSFALRIGNRKNRLKPKNFHFQSFQNIGSASGSIRVERRGARTLCRISGEIKEDFPFHEIDFSEVKELSFDLRLLEKWDALESRFANEVFRKMSLVHKFHFEYVHYRNMVNVNAMISQSNKPGEIRSILIPFSCSSCEKSFEILFMRSCSEDVDAGNPVCETCEGELQPDPEIVGIITGQ